MLVTIQDDFDLKKIALSGQCFRMHEREDGSFFLVTGSHFLTIRKRDEQTCDAICSESDWRNVWMPYFDLGCRNYEAIRRSIPASDSFLYAAAEEGKGIRILRQEPWETLITFIISQRKSIPAIRQSVELLCTRFGTSMETPVGTVFQFPTPEQLRNADEKALAECKLGYRVPYAMDAVRRALDGRLCFSDACSLSDEALLSMLMSVLGVGIKVANCTALFAFGRTALAPVDTWIQKIINEKYNGVNPFPAYGENAGILQQYAFFHAQQHKKEALTP